MTKKISASRKANQRERQARRDEILDRHESRERFAKWFAGVGGEEKELESVIANLLTASSEGFVAPSVLISLLPREFQLRILLRALRIIELKEMEYDKYLETPEWAALASQAKDKYYGRCALDEKHPADHAHHRTYKRRGREWPEDLVPLCAACHSTFHKR